MISPVLEIDTLTTIVGIKGIDDDLEIDVQPNPFVNELYITLSGTDRHFWVELYSNDGKKVFSDKMSGLEKKQLNLQNLASGTYELVVREESGVEKEHVKILKIY